MKQKKHRLVSALLVLVILVSAGMVQISTANAAGAGPGDARTPSGEWQSLAAGESEWYAFYYAGDGSEIEVRMQVEPKDSLEFTVWTPDKIKRWLNGSDPVPIGRSAADSRTEGALVWSGSFPVEGTYYVIVKRIGNYTGTSYYQLQVSGSGVSLSAPEATATPTATASATKKTTPAAATGKLVFQTTFGGYFYTINVDGSGLQRITTGMDPVWSPSGDQIAFVRWDSPRGVWVVNADGSGEYRVFDWGETRYPSWSPDGQEIVFMRQSEAESSSGGGKGGRGPRGGGGPGGGGASASEQQLAIVNPSTLEFREPSPASDTSQTPDWSPSGEQIVFRGLRGLQVESADGKESYQLTSDVWDNTPVWSPDGTKVAFIHRQHDHWEIYVVDVASGKQTRLTNTPALSDGTTASSVSPAWSPDGSYIAFFTNRTGEWEIWVMQADGSNAKPMFDTELNRLTLQYSFNSERAISWTK